MVFCFPYVAVRIVRIGTTVRQWCKDVNEIPKFGGFTKNKCFNIFTNMTTKMYGRIDCLTFETLKDCLVIAPKSFDRGLF